MRLPVRLPELLSRINGVRRTLGLEPLTEVPKGRQRRRTQCPLARGFNKGCSVDGRVTFRSMQDADKLAGKRGWRRSIVNPRAVWGPEWVSRFVSDFDAGKYPDLIEETK